LLIVRIWNILMGYVIIRVEGLSLEKFINLSASKGIHLWGIERISYTTLQARVSINGFRKLRPVLRKVRCRITIVDKRGLPFLTYRLKKRKMLVAGMIICLTLLYGFSSFVWVIEVKGTEKLDSSVIMNALHENGIEPGIWKGHINIRDLENELMIQLPQISWVGLELRGVKLVAEIVEAVQPPPFIDKETPCNIIASKDGIIAKMTVLEGKPTVQIGSTVRKGQLLVSGVIEHEGIGVRYVHARGEILARTWFEGKGKAPLRESMKVPTGRKVVRKYIRLGSIKVKVQEDPILFGKFEKTVSRQPLLGENLFLPVEMLIEEYHEVKEIHKKMAIDQVRQLAQDQAWKEAQQKIPQHAKVVDKKVKFSMIEEEFIEAVMYVETLEPIGVQAPLSVDKEELKFEQPTVGKKNRD
jgi:similar to stage IV sporulation protein